MILHSYTWFDFCICSMWIQNLAQNLISTWISTFMTASDRHIFGLLSRSFCICASHPSAFLDVCEGRILTPLQISCRCVSDFPSFPSDGPISLLPQSHTITGTNLFGVLKQTGWSCNDSTCQPEKRQRKRTLSKHTQSTEEHEKQANELCTEWDLISLRVNTKVAVSLKPAHYTDIRRSLLSFWSLSLCFCLDKKKMIQTQWLSTLSQQTQKNPILITLLRRMTVKN